ASSLPSISTRASWTILTTCCPGVTERSTCCPTACSVALSTKLRTTGRATSASSSAIRTSRIAPRTSASVSAPRPRSRSNTPDRRSPRLSNIGLAPQPFTSAPNANAPAGETSPASVRAWRFKTHPSSGSRAYSGRRWRTQVRRRSAADEQEGDRRHDAGEGGKVTPVERLAQHRDHERAEDDERDRLLRDLELARAPAAGIADP